MEGGDVSARNFGRGVSEISEFSIREEQADDGGGTSCSENDEGRHSEGSEFSGGSSSEGYLDFDNSFSSNGMMQLESRAPTYPDGEYEDDKADMIAALMQNHSDVVISSLVERSNLIQSVKWLSHHVPQCVMRSLFKSILRARKKKRRGVEERRRHTAQQQQDGQQKKPVIKRGISELSAESQSSQERGGDGERATSDIDEEPPTPTQTNLSTQLEEDNINILPVTKSHNGALLFVDITGFTKISVMLDVESLSNAINSYFQMIVNEITKFGGDILKFAGDAIFAEWKATKHNNKHLERCVSLAAECAAGIVANCSDYAVLSNPIGFTAAERKLGLVPVQATQMISSWGACEGGEEERKFSEEQSSIAGEQSSIAKRLSRRASTEMIRRGSTATDVNVAVLNVKCAIGAGHIVGIHVGDDILRREYLILGEPIDQVSKAERVASHGEVFASPEAVKYLAKSCKLRGDWEDAGGNLRVDWEEAVENGRPVRIAERKKRYFDGGGKSSNPLDKSNEVGNMLRSCEDLDTMELAWLRRMMALYVHPVVVNNINERALPMRRGSSDHERHLAEAELRNVYTCFITPLIDYTVTGDDKKDQKLFKILNDIMNVTTRELDRVQGHLRQFILDDKGLVLICTFGLRGSTFPNMIAQRAMPFTFSIHTALEEELGVRSKIGATFGKAYCGFVGGLERHEFAVLGPSVNLSARLMGSKGNPGILVDKNVRLLTSQIFFKPLPAVEAKGYDEPVPIFEPLQNAAPDNQWGSVRKNFVGRAKEIKDIMRLAKDLAVHDGTASKMLFISAVSGTGKSTLMVNATEHVRAMMKKMDKRVIVTRNVSREGDTRIPFR